MLTARVGSEVIRAGYNLKDKDFVYRCRDPHCKAPEMLLVAGARGLRVPHFRHKTDTGCKCGKGETAWHLEWKSHFDRVEVDMGLDPVTNEMNRADAVVGNLVIEFQHSPITPEEQEARERYYASTGGMIWVVDASSARMRNRLKSTSRVSPAFLDMLHEPFQGFSQCNQPEFSFGPIWSNRPVGVAFDYGSGYDMLYVLPVDGDARAPKCLGKWYKKEDFIEAVKNRSEEFTRLPAWYVEDVERKKKAEAEKKIIQEAARVLYQQEYAQAVRIARQRQDPRQFPKNAAIEKLSHFDVYVDCLGRGYRLVGRRFYPL